MKANMITQQNILHVRQMTESDVVPLTRIVSENYSKETAEHFAGEMLCSFMPYPFRLTMFVAEIDGQLVGCGGFNQNWLAYGAYTLAWVNVDKRLQGKGVGRAIVTCLLDALRCKATYVVLATSVPDFYSKCFGFEVIDTFAAFGLDGNIVMRKQL